MKRHYGWKPDLPDQRDYSFSAPPRHLPPAVDLRPECPPVFDQGNLGSCTANAIANAHLFAQFKENEVPVTPSRLFIYFNERDIEGTVNHDSGAEIRDGFKSIAHAGVCPESEWPYRVTKFAQRPTAKCFTDAKKHLAVQYQRITQTIAQLKGCLADGFPFVFGFTVYDSFESDAVAQSGVLNLPAKSEKPLGGHAVLCVGYDESSQRFLVMNSWGTEWGQKGFFTMPYQYVLNSNLADDIWTLRLVK